MLNSPTYQTKTMKRTLFTHCCIITLILLGYTPSVMAQFTTKKAQFFIQGSFRDSSRTQESIPGVTISNGEEGTRSDLNGDFNFSLPAGNHNLIIKCIGYHDKFLTIQNLKENRNIGVIFLKEKSVDFKQLVISAGKFQQDIANVTMSMEVIQPRLLQDKNVTSLEDGLQQVPGVIIVDDEPQIRSGSGYSFGAGSRVQVLIDDIPILSGDAGKASWAFLPMENIAQLEIIKGASSVLYGSSALSGVIHFRTAYPTSTPKTRFQVWSGIYSAPKGPHHYWNGLNKKAGYFFNHSQKNGNWEWLLAATLQADDGHMGPNKDSLGQVLPYDQNPFTVDRYSSENRSRINFQLRHRNPKIQGLSYGINGIVAQSQSLSTLIWENSTNGLFGAYSGSNTYTYQLVSALDPFVEYYNKKGSKHSIKSRWQSLDNYNDNAQGNYSDVYYTEYQYQQDWESWGIPGIRTTIGAVNSITQAKGELYIGGNTNGINSASNRAAFFQADGQWRKRLFLSAGCRLEQFTINQEKSQKPVFRAGINYKWFEHTHLRASYGQGFRFPSIAEKFIITALGAVKVYANPDLKPESSENLELGIKQGFQLGQFKGYIDAAAFQQTFDQFIEFTFGQWAENPGLNNMLGLGFKSLNTGSAKVQGAEVSIMGTGEIRPGTNIDLLAGYTYTKPTSTTPNFNYATRAMDNPFILPIFAQTNYTSTSSNPSNNILKYRMQHLIRGDVSLRQSHWHIGFSSRYNSHMQNIDNAFEKLEFYFPKDFNPGIIQWRESHQKGDWIFDARAGINWNNQQLTISVNNLTNRLYAIRPLAIESTRLINIQYSIEL